MKFWLIVLMLGALTLFGRTSFILLFSNWQTPAWFQKSLRFVPVAAFSAIVAPAVLRSTDGSLELSLLTPKILAALVTIVVAYVGRNILLTIAFGMGTLWLATWLLAA